MEPLTFSANAAVPSEAAAAAPRPPAFSARTASAVSPQSVKAGSNDDGRAPALLVNSRSIHDNAGAADGTTGAAVAADEPTIANAELRTRAATAAFANGRVMRMFLVLAGTGGTSTDERVPTAKRTPAAATSTAIGICLPFRFSGSPCGLTVAGQRRFLTGFPLRGKCDCRRSLSPAQPSRLRCRPRLVRGEGAGPQAVLPLRVDTLESQRELVGQQREPLRPVVDDASRRTGLRDFRVTQRTNGRDAIAMAALDNDVADEA